MKTKVEVKEMSEFVHMFEGLKKEMRESAARQDQKLQELAERHSEEMRDVIERNLDEMQESMLKFQEYYITKKNEVTSSNTPAANILNDSIIIATSTGTTTTILPSDELNLNTDTTTTNNNNNNDNNNFVASIVYVDDDYYSNSNYDAFLSSEDYDFVSSIQSTAFIGIYLPPILWNSFDISSLATTIFPKLENNVCQFQCLFTITSRNTSFKAATVLSNLRNYYNHVIRLTIYDIYKM